MVFWVGIGAAAYMGLLALVLGICRAASRSDQADRAEFERWLATRPPTSAERRPAA